MEASRPEVEPNDEKLSVGVVELRPEIMMDEELGASQLDQLQDDDTSKAAYCPVCYEPFSEKVESQEDESLTDRQEKVELMGCHHEFCRDCLVNHCKHAVSVREIPICCPAKASDNCAVDLPEDLIQELLYRPDSVQYGSISDTSLENSRNKDWNRYLRFKRLLDDPLLTDCTNCSELLSKDDNRALGDDKNKLTCPFCGHVFCAIHGDAHAGMSCDQYKPAQQIKKSEKIIQKFAKPCSHCGVPIQKASGCDHIICVSCKQDMCFRCGTHEHLTGDMVRSCKQCEQNFIDHRHIWAYRLTLCLSLPFYLPLCLAHILIMTVLAVATLGCFCCFCCGFRVDAKGDAAIDPMRGIRTTFGMIFLPLIDLFRQCGIPCCLPLEFPELEATKTDEISSDDDFDVEQDDDSAEIET